MYEIRDPVYGFIRINDWEKEVIDHPIFQRLRRIKQMGLTEMVYPSATHSRFEHSLGVMCLATKLFDAITRNKDNLKLLKQKLFYEKAGIERDRQLMRFAALLHDIGHAPFSHGGEDLMPKNPETGEPFRHEDYTVAIIKEKLKDVIEENPMNIANWHIKAEEVAALIKGDPKILGPRIFWRVLISSQLDADRGDYLLRDSHHIGVQYGKYDVDRLINTITLGIEPETNDPTLCVETGGWHVAEALLIARYQMFTQVYFHKTRRAYDCHLSEALKKILPDGNFPPPVRVDEFLKWDDYKTYYSISKSTAEDCQAILNRNHVRTIYETTEIPDEKEIKKLDKAKGILDDLVVYEDTAEGSWYKVNSDESRKIEIYIKDKQKNELKPLSTYSNIVKNMKDIKQVRLYVLLQKREEAKKRLKKGGLL